MRANALFSASSPLLAGKLNRIQILQSPLNSTATLIRIAVHRNHSFELVGSVLNAFLNISGLKAEFWYSDYDHSLSFTSLPEQADIHLVWLDAVHYSLAEFAPWLESRVLALQGRAKGKVIVACCGPPPLSTMDLPDVVVLDVDAAVQELAEAAYDLRREPLTGTRLSSASTLLLARELGMRCIPALLLPALKGLVLDLDNTLYAGVLGEDGPQGVQPYTEVQEYLANLGKKGFFLTLASKNTEEDVRALFTQRSDFPLRWEDFSAWGINWSAKAHNIQAIANTLHIGVDSLLFVDDNPGEILQAAQALPLLHVLEAASPQQTLAALRYYPGLFKTTSTTEDSLRSSDIKANVEREKLQASLSPQEYMRELGLEMVFAANPARQAQRIGELLHKTNQFILAFMRPNQGEVGMFLSQPGKCVLTVSMKDVLSDSGVIAVLLAEAGDRCMEVQEVVVSCRALGRGVEEAMLAQMLLLAQQTLQAGPAVRIAYTKGPRNAPALLWLEKLAGNPLPDKGFVVLEAPPSANLVGITFTVEQA